MAKLVNAVVAAVFAAGLSGAPAAFAQTSDGATSTGGAKFEKDRADMDAVRKQEIAPTDAPTEPGSEGRKPMDDDTTGSTSEAKPKTGAPLGPTDTLD